ncbi:MAG: nucleotidyltransferase family protein [Akkermansiaceae bacterium]
MRLQKTELEDLTVASQASLIDGMRAIDRGALQLAVVEDQRRKVIGIITDGDIRRGLIKGMSLDDPLVPVVNQDFFSVSLSTPRADVLDSMLAREFEQVPVLDDEGKLVGIHLLTDFLSVKQRSNAAVVMAGGKGTRLGELTRALPKPMIKVAGRPILERIIHQLVGSGISNIFLSVNYLSEVIEKHFGDGRRFGCEISYLRETEPMGSGGALSLLPDSLEDPILVMNGDLISQFDIDAFLKTHDEKQAAITVGVQEYRHSVPFGCVKTRDGCIEELEEKPTLVRTINTGIYAISPSYFRQVPCEFFPMTQLLESALAKGDTVASHRVDEWIDVGEPRQLAEARGEDS